MNRSEQIGKLAEALAKAQGQIEGAVKDSTNPFFKSKYSSLASVIDAIRGPFSKNGIAWTQLARSTDGGVEVETVLAHNSGEWISETLSLPVAKHDAQGIGSAISYAKRYSLQSMAGVPSEDDDGNAAAASTRDARKCGLEILGVAVPKGTEALASAWSTLSHDMRVACKGDLDKLKADAAKHSKEANRSNHAAASA